MGSGSPSRVPSARGRTGPRSVVNAGSLAPANAGSHRRSRAIPERSRGRCVPEMRMAYSGNTENTGWSRGTQALGYAPQAVRKLLPTIGVGWAEDIHRGPGQG